MQIGLVVAQFAAIGKRFGAAARLGKNQFARGRIPFVGLRRTDIIIDFAFGQEAKFVGTTLLHHFQIGPTSAQIVDMRMGFGRLVRPRHRHHELIARRRRRRIGARRQKPSVRHSTSAGVRENGEADVSFGLFAMIGNYAAIGLSDTILINFHHLTVVCHKAIYFAYFFSDTR